MSEIRLKKLESLLQQEISLLIVNKKVKDPRVSTLVSVTRVVVSKDTAYAKVYISCLEGGESLSASAEALNSAAGFLQSQLAKKIHLRQTPKLSFIADPAMAEAFLINKKIEDLNT
ncbi:MAG: 30S ribosome-binding factor RbfA [Spirochaetales bacterium]|nr:MAG: 30S ribosome-binding factor RbfA [Spirochaetales bacterium]